VQLFKCKFETQIGTGGIMTITLERLRNAVANDAAMRRVQKLQPVGGPGDKIFPPTYPGERSTDPARHVFETRRIDGKDVRCVLIDSVQSQANRLEEALLGAIRAGRIAMPYITVAFKDQRAPDGIDISDLGEITSLDAPHRVFDAIIRDSELDGTKFTDTDHYQALLLAKPTNAIQVFNLSPTSLVFGVWNSTGEGGGVGAKFTRCIVSEIIGVGAAEGQKGAVRIDPLGIRASVKVVGGPLDWNLATGAKGEKSHRPSEINHSNIISNLVPGGITIDYALHTAVLSYAGLRRLKFPGASDDTAARVVLAAIMLVALAEQDATGYALRSRCDLVCDGKAPFEIVHPDGSTESFEINAEGAAGLFKEAVSAAKQAGLSWDEQPLVLVPQQRLVELVAMSRAQALAGEREEDGR
jgi:CRISPR-associated protein Csb1